MSRKKGRYRIGELVRKYKPQAPEGTYWAPTGNIKEWVLRKVNLDEFEEPPRRDLESDTPRIVSQADAIDRAITEKLDREGHGVENK